jgi:protein SCO1/2
MRRALLLASLVLLSFACGKQQKPLSEPGEKLYTLKGTILSRDASDNSLRVDHEAVPGFMEAMTMDYPVRGAKVAQLPPDKAKVEAKLHVHDERYWLTDVKKAP